MSENIIELKTDPGVFDLTWHGMKTFEIRYNDRKFKVGDLLRLKETIFTGAEMAEKDKPKAFTGRQVDVLVRHIMYGPIYGLTDGWVIMSVERIGQRLWPGQ